MIRRLSEDEMDDRHHLLVADTNIQETDAQDDATVLPGNTDIQETGQHEDDASKHLTDSNTQEPDTQEEDSTGTRQVSLLVIIKLPVSHQHLIPEWHWQIYDQNLSVQWKASTAILCWCLLVSIIIIIYDVSVCRGWKKTNLKMPDKGLMPARTFSPFGLEESNSVGETAICWKAVWPCLNAWVSVQ